MLYKGGFPLLSDKKSFFPHNNALTFTIKLTYFRDFLFKSPAADLSILTINVQSSIDICGC